MFRSEIYKLSRMQATVILAAVIFISLLLINILLSGTIDGIYITSHDKSGSVTFENMFMSSITFLQSFYALPLLVIIITAVSFSEEMQNKTIYQSILAAKNRIHLFVTKATSVIIVVSAIIAAALVLGIILYLVFAENGPYGVPLRNVNIAELLSFIVVFLLNNIFIVSIATIFCVTVHNSTIAAIITFISVIIMDILENISSVKHFLPTYLGDSSVFIYKGIEGYEFANIGLLILYILTAGIASAYLFNNTDL
ncbi:MAG: hypothetical protein ACOX22_05875 [Caldicoprobacterales bacterium]|jgi:ABC-type transport system involved in multi-copper enzyme maturation permease subunit|nr:hypothetical protein [Clostridiales bacterium]